MRAVVGSSTRRSSHRADILVTPQRPAQRQGSQHTVMEVWAHNAGMLGAAGLPTAYRSITVHARIAASIRCHSRAYGASAMISVERTTEQCSPLRSADNKGDGVAPAHKKAMDKDTPRTTGALLLAWSKRFSSSGSTNTAIWRNRIRLKQAFPNMSSDHVFVCSSFPCYRLQSAAISKPAIRVSAEFPMKPYTLLITCR
jgi:hypothetical protein